MHCTIGLRYAFILLKGGILMSFLHNYAFAIVLAFTALVWSMVLYQPAGGTFHVAQVETSSPYVAPYDPYQQQPAYDPYSSTEDSDELNKVPAPKVHPQYKQFMEQQRQGGGEANTWEDLDSYWF